MMRSPFALAVCVLTATSLVACSSPSTSSVPASNAASTIQARPAKYSGLNDLYVADYGAGSIVKLKNVGFRPDGAIFTGINGPTGLSIDRRGNLYVANSSGVDVTAYAPGATAPSFTYSAAMVEPLDVALDTKSNVYEVDSGNTGGVGDKPGFVNEYAPNSNAVLATCGGLDSPIGIAIDRNDDVFVTTNDTTGGRIVEFKGGLQGCAATELTPKFYFVVGLALDKNLNLIAADYGGRVDVLAPPYTTVTRTLTWGRVQQPYWISINRANTLLFVTNFFNDDLFAVDYATGKIVNKFGVFHGHISAAAGTADGPDLY